MAHQLLSLAFFFDRATGAEGKASSVVSQDWIIRVGGCGYLCVLGRLIDLFDWAIGKCVTRFRILGDGRLVRIKYYLFAAALMAVLLGVLMSRFVVVIPLIMRGLLFLGEPLQSGMARG